MENMQEPSHQCNTYLCDRENEPFTKSFEFYVSSGNKDLMRHLNEIMQKQGYLGLADGGGKMHYVVDGSGNLYQSANVITGILKEQTQKFGISEQDYSQQYWRKRIQIKAVEKILHAYHLNPSLKGYGYIRSIILAVLEKEPQIVFPDKEIYMEVAQLHGTGRKQLDRVIRYSLSKAGLNLKNSQAITAFIKESREEAEKMFQEFFPEIPM